MIYSHREIEIIAQGGRKLAKIKRALQPLIVAGATGLELDKKAEEMTAQEGGKPSFKMVPGYHWTTCVNVNDGVVHGIPNDMPFKNGDIVSVDVGIFYKSFHTDSAFTIPVGKVSPEVERFLAVGSNALSEAISCAKVGNRIADVAGAIGKVVAAAGYSPVRELTGHGVGRSLHEAPAIPCFWEGNRLDSDIISEGAVLAVEVIYTQGSPELVLAEDGWTIATQNGKIAGLFEETIALVGGRPVPLT